MFYTYTFFIDNIPEYVGKGKGTRCLEHFRPRKGAETHWTRHLAKAKAEGKSIELLVSHKATEQEAIDAEIVLIAKYGRLDKGTGTLFNKTDGGQGFSGSTKTKEQIMQSVQTRYAKYGENAFKPSEQTLNKIRSAQTGKQYSDEVNKKKGRPGRPLTAEHRESIKRSWEKRKTKSLISTPN